MVVTLRSGRHIESIKEEEKKMTEREEERRNENKKTEEEKHIEIGGEKKL